MLRIRFQLDAGDALHLPDRLSDLTQVLSSAVGVIDRAIQRNFDEEGRPHPWPPLTPRYARWKAAHFPGRKILALQGTLRRSIHIRVEPGQRFGSAHIVASTDVPYAAAHQFGVPQRRLPARPFLILTREDEEEVAQVIAHALAESLENTDHESRARPERSRRVTSHD